MLEDFLKYIKKNLEAIPASKGEKNKLYIDHLTVIKERIKQAQEYINDSETYYQSIEDILKYIEKIPIKTSTHVQTLGEILANEKEKYPTIIKKHETLTTKLTPLTDKQRPIFGSIHIDLMKYYQSMWFYSYKANLQQEISNAAIREWQNGMQEDSANPLNAYKDFRRSFAIQNKTATEEDDDDLINSRINQLVSHANYYLVEDKLLLIKWLQSNGGQEITRFIDKAFEHKNFSFQLKDKIELPPPNIGKCTTLKANWYLDDDQRICFEYSVAVHTISFGMDKAIFADAKGNFKETKNDNELEEASTSDKKATVMRINANIKLEVFAKNNGEIFVNPTPTKIDVLCFTHLIAPNPNIFGQPLLQQFGLLAQTLPQLRKRIASFTGELSLNSISQSQ